MGGSRGPHSDRDPVPTPGLHAPIWELRLVYRPRPGGKRCLPEQNGSAQDVVWVMRRRATKHLQKPFSELVLQEERTEAVGQTGQRVQEERTF